MERLKYLILGVFALTLASCSQAVIEDLKVPENPGYNAPGYGKTAVILPFADYSDGDTLESAHRRNLMITETITDRLSGHGFSLPVQEDVFQYLVTENVISLAHYKNNMSKSLAYEIDKGDWSVKMKSILQDYADQRLENSNGAVNSPGAHGLSSKTVAKIGRQFHADYIVRGRILEYKTRYETTWEPWKKGILPFVNGAANQVLFGFASSDEYDERNSIITGGILGSSLGHDASWPWDDSSDEILGITGGADANSIFWGIAGAGIGKAAHQSGKVDQAVVQLRMWIQEADSGQVVWTNRISVKVTPESVFADNQYDTLFNAAIEKGVTKLIDNFVIYTLL